MYLWGFKLQEPRVKEEPNFVMSLNLARWRKGEIQRTFYRLLSMCQITNTSYTLPVASTQQCFQVGSITNLISQMRNLKDRKVKELVQGSTAGKWWASFKPHLNLSRVTNSCPVRPPQWCLNGDKCFLGACRITDTRHLLKASFSSGLEAYSWQALLIGRS